MAMRRGYASHFARTGNLTNTERLLSVLAGLGLTVAALRGGGPMRRIGMSTAGLSLLSRGAAGYCGMKAAVSGERTLREGITEQLHRLRGLRGSAAARIDSMESMFVAELQELHSAEAQLARLLDELADTTRHLPLQQQLRGYATELASRCEDLERMLADDGTDPHEHPDQAAQALIHETWKMAQIATPNLRDAALVASLQRIIHYKIAGYGTVATYAKSLGRIDAAARFAEYADREKAVDGELTELAKSRLNPDATLETQPRTPPEVRPH